MSLVVAENLVMVGRVSIWEHFFPTNIQYYPSIWESVHLFNPFEVFSFSSFCELCYWDTKPSNMLGEYWILIATSRHKLYFADSSGGDNYSFLKEHLKQVLPGPLETHPSFCGFYTIYSVFHFLNFRWEDITRNHDVILLPYINVIKCKMFFFSM